MGAASCNVDEQPGSTTIIVAVIVIVTITYLLRCGSLILKWSLSFIGALGRFCQTSVVGEDGIEVVGVSVAVDAVDVVVAVAVDGDVVAVVKHRTTLGTARKTLYKQVMRCVERGRTQVAILRWL
jgi:hypothetical protein